VPQPQAANLNLRYQDTKKRISYPILKIHNWRKEKKKNLRNEDINNLYSSPSIIKAQGNSFLCLTNIGTRWRCVVSFTPPGKELPVIIG